MRLFPGLTVGVVQEGPMPPCEGGGTEHLTKNREGTDERGGEMKEFDLLVISGV